MAIPRRSEEWSDELDPREASWWNPASWGVVKDTAKGIGDLGKGAIDLAKGDFSGAGKDLKNFGKDEVNAVKDVGSSVLHGVEQTGKFVGNHWQQILPAVGLLALNLIPGVGEVADAALVADVATEGAAATATAAEATATAAEGAASSIPSIGTSAVESTAGTAAEGAASTAEGAASEASGATSKIQQAKDLIKGTGQNLKDKATNAIEHPIETAKDLAKNPVVQTQALSDATGSGGGSDQTQQAAPVTAPAPTFQPQMIQGPVDTTTSAEGSAIGAGTYGASKNILELVYEFGLHPEDIKQSLTSWQ